jgi:hypothetical protein
MSMRKLAPISQAAYELTARNSSEMCGMSVQVFPQKILGNHFRVSTNDGQTTQTDTLPTVS